MNNYILTGAPGAGKTSIIRSLENKGRNVVEEAATDIILLEQKQGIAKPWDNPNFLDKILSLQKERYKNSQTLKEVFFFDRSPICTYALCQFLGYTPSTLLLEEIERINELSLYHKKVFFIESLESIEHTDIRQINYQDALVFSKLHFEIYTQLDFECISIPPQELEKRVSLILQHI
ncbi:MAG: AAA family ATPase [Candidatus Pacebacteria bacterium]|nr:AAA family ATPase [Candidatus Paceibacterota bacterium]